MARIANEDKVLIVQRLATFVSYTGIIKELTELGTVVTMRQIAHYDPQSATCEASKQLRALYDTTRARFIEATSDIAIAHQSVRLRELDRLYRHVAGGARPNAVLGASLLEHAAKEVGGMFTNRREVTGRDGKDLIPDAQLDDLSDEQLASLAVQLAGELGKP